MKILVVGPTEPFGGGITHHTSNLAEAFSKNHSVRLLGWYRQYPKPFYNGLASAEKSEIRLLSYRNPLTWIAAGRAARDYDKVVLPWTTPFHILTYLTIGMLTGFSKLSVHVHNVSPHERFPAWKTLTRLFFRRDVKLVCHAKYLATQIEALGATRKPLVVPHPPNLLLKPGKPSSPPLIVFFGYIRPYKGIDTFLATAAACKDQGLNYKFLIAGQPWGDQATLIKKRIEELDLKATAQTQLGYVSDEETEAIFDEASILLAPYKQATQSGVIPLAFSAGVVPITTDVGGLGEIIETGHNGELLSSQASVNDYVQALNRVLKNFERYREAGLASASTWDSIAPSYLDDNV